MFSRLTITDTTYFSNFTLEGPCIIFFNMYRVELDTQRGCIDYVFISTQVSALHVSDRNGPSAGASLLDAVCADCTYSI